MIQLISIAHSVPASDWIATLVAVLAIFSLLFISELAHKKFGMSKYTARKAVHIIVGLFICLFSYFLISNIPILLLAAVFLIFDTWALKTSHFTSIHPMVYSLGTVFYPISVFIMAFFLWDNFKSIFIIATLIMVLPDALAALAGEKYSTTFFIPLKEKKSVIGTWVMFLSTFILVFIALVGFLNQNVYKASVISLLIALLATASELISVRGSDNLSVPLVSALFLYAYLNPWSQDASFQLTCGILLSAMVSFISYRYSLLQLNGAIATFLLGSIIFGFGGIPYAIPILAFFVVSSLLSRIGKGRKKYFESLFAKTGHRDIYQVLANGGIAGLMVLFMYLSHINYVYPLYLIAIAAATADTWATELGVFSPWQPRLITDFRIVEAGTSGAVSLLGSAAALLGSLFIAVIGYSVNPDISANPVSWSTLLVVITVFGFISSFIDSYLGALFQAQYRCSSCQNLTEKPMHCDLKAQLVHGYRWLNNDLVNVLSIVITTILAYILMGIVY